MVEQMQGSLQRRNEQCVNSWVKNNNTASMAQRQDTAPEGQSINPTPSTASSLKTYHVLLLVDPWKRVFTSWERSTNAGHTCTRTSRVGHSSHQDVWMQSVHWCPSANPAPCPVQKGGTVNPMNQPAFPYQIIQLLFCQSIIHS